MKDIFLLDMDETLLDFPAAERRNLTETLKAFGWEIGEEEVARFHAINDGLWKMLERGGISREELKSRRFEMLFEEYGKTGEIGAISARYYANFPGICIPYPGALSFVRELAARGRVYLVTNGGADVQHAHARDAGFTPFLSDSFISEEVGFNKPSEAYAAFVAAHIPAYSRERAVYLGDSLTSDRKCAERMGVDFVLFAPSGPPDGYGGACARDYAEALRLLCGGE